jgi:hypothetical protein
MTTVAVCMTVWDVLANAFDDPGFWGVSIFGMLFTSLIIRRFYNRSRRAV